MLLPAKPHFEPAVSLKRLQAAEQGRTVSPGKPTMASPLMDALGMWRLMLSMMRLYRLCVYPRLHSRPCF